MEIKSVAIPARTDLYSKEDRDEIIKKVYNISRPARDSIPRLFNIIDNIPFGVEHSCKADELARCRGNEAHSLRFCGSYFEINLQLQF